MVSPEDALDMALDDVIKSGGRGGKKGKGKGKGAKAVGQGSGAVGEAKAVKVAKTTTRKPQKDSQGGDKLDLSLDEVIEADSSGGWKSGRGGKEKGPAKVQDAGSAPVKAPAKASWSNDKTKVWAGSWVKPGAAAATQKDDGYSKKWQGKADDAAGSGSWAARSTAPAGGGSGGSWAQSKNSSWEDNSSGWKAKAADQTGKVAAKGWQDWSGKTKSSGQDAGPGGGWVSSWESAKTGGGSKGGAGSSGWVENGNREVSGGRQVSAGYDADGPSWKKQDQWKASDRAPASSGRDGRMQRDDRGPVYAPKEDQWAAKGTKRERDWEGSSSGYERAKPWENPPKRAATAPAARGGPRKIQVTNIPPDLETQDIRNAFEQEAGIILECVLRKGTAWITFENTADAARAVDTFDRGELNGRIIDVIFQD